VCRIASATSSSEAKSISQDLCDRIDNCVGSGAVPSSRCTRRASRTVDCNTWTDTSTGVRCETVVRVRMESYGLDFSFPGESECHYY
jgi:hypothetical protein